MENNLNPKSSNLNTISIVQDNKIVIYNNGEIDLEVSIKDETVWLTQKEISILFEKDRTVITRHINNILKDKEANEKSNVQKMHFANSDKPVKLYSLDIVLAVGYRTNSAKAIKFRQWATKVLKEYIYNSYAINREKITQQRISNLEKDVEFIKSHIKNNTLEFKQGIFYNGEIFDAYKFINGLIKSAKKEIILIDNYVDESILTLFSKVPNIKVTIYTHNINKQLKLDFQKYQTQYNNITLKIFKNSHDRFLIIDKQEIYHIGASLKDLGKKWFAFSKIDMENINILQRLK